MNKLLLYTELKKGDEAEYTQFTLANDAVDHVRHL